MKDINHVTRISLILDALYEACKDARAAGLGVDLDVRHDGKKVKSFGEYDEGCPMVDAHIERAWDV